MPDVVELILEDHEEFRRRFAHVRALTDPTQIRERWGPLRALLEVHADAEEAVVYPALGRSGDEGAEETQDAVHEHNEIRDAIGETEEHEPGTELFLLALRQVEAANDHHMAEEEQEFLPAFKEQFDAKVRDKLGSRFIEFKRDHEAQAAVTHRDPERYLAEVQEGMDPSPEAASATTEKE